MTGKEIRYWMPSGPRTDEDFMAGDDVKDFLGNQAKIFDIGCEILANLALTFDWVQVIDLDTIGIDNSNRQPKDVGKSKAIVAAEFIMNRVPGVLVAPTRMRLLSPIKPTYLDSLEARRWINATLVNLVDPENPESLKPLIDGGTEGYKGQARVILPTITSCYECSLDMLNKPTAFPICTIANTPRLPEHCIEWASVLEWPRVHGDKKMDTDNPDDISWLYAVASVQAKEFKIEGVTWSLTQGVVKNIIPAIASTNAIIAVVPPCHIAPVTRAWKQGYLGDYDKLLLQNMDSSQSPGDYGNVAAIVQSSGYGKSRTVDEIAKQVFTIPMNVRNPIDTSCAYAAFIYKALDTYSPTVGAYPPPDLELHEFLANSGLLVSRTNAFAFVMHLGETVIKFVKQMIKDVYDVPLEDVGRSWWLEFGRPLPIQTLQPNGGSTCSRTSHPSTLSLRVPVLSLTRFMKRSRARSET
ncbi:hypothetical protein F5877DRAFT_75376 [Lentinula edodes]|nr:hypothetical protein F5877DRAFT_75376 [Lentinula edodes]